MHAPHDSFEAATLADIVADFDPDILLVAGDAVDRRGDEHLVSAYGALPARYGKFAALGNWEYQGACDVSRLRREYERAGVRLLVNERAVVDVGGQQLDIVGLDDLLRGRPLLDLVRSPTAPRADRSLVMAHCPALFDEVARASTSPSVVLSGHTHGGQIAPFGHVFMTPLGSGAYVKGWYGASGTAHRLYVSRGLGNSRIPLRVGSRPEIALLTL
jgi:predicted MPP superfamily phosphohydrolase